MNSSARCWVGDCPASAMVSTAGDVTVHVSCKKDQPMSMAFLTDALCLQDTTGADPIAGATCTLDMSASPLAQPACSSGDILWLLRSAAALLDTLRAAENDGVVHFPGKTDAFCFDAAGKAHLLPAFHVSTSSTTPESIEPVSASILKGLVIAAPEVRQALESDSATIDVAGQGSWVAGCFLKHLASSNLASSPEHALTAPHELDVHGPVSRSKLSGAFMQVCESLWSEEARCRVSIGGAAAALSRLCAASGIQQQLPGSCTAKVLFTKTSDTGALDVHHVDVQLPPTGLQTPLSDVAAAVQAALKDAGLDLPAVHLSVPSWGQSLPTHISYAFAPHALVPASLGHYGMAAVADGCGTRLHCALWATPQPSALPPAAQLLGGHTMYQPVDVQLGTGRGAPSPVAAVTSAERQEGVEGAAAQGNAQVAAAGAADPSAVDTDAAQDQLADAATPADVTPAPEMTFPVRGFSSTDKNPYSTVEGNFASSVKWGSVMCVLQDSAGLSTGKHSWAFRVSKKGSRGGVCIGVATAEFNAATKNLGPALHSWGYSSSGKRSAGYPEFLDYAEGFGQDDVVGVHLDCDAGTLAFSKNARYLGVAFTDLQGRSVFPAVCMGGRSSSSSKRQQLPHELEALTNAQEYIHAVRASQLQAPADKPSFHFAWELPATPDEATDAAAASAAQPSVGGGGWDLTLPVSAADGVDGAVQLALLQHPPMGTVGDSNPTGRYEFGFDCQSVPEDATVWFVLASSTAVGACQALQPGLLRLAEGICKPGIWAVSSAGHVVQDGVLGDERIQWPEGVEFSAVRNVGVVFGLPAVDLASVEMTKNTPDTDLPEFALVLDHKHAVSAPGWRQGPWWDACLAGGGMRIGVAAREPAEGVSSNTLHLRSDEIVRMVSFDRANSHIKVSMGGSTAECAAQWASAPLAHSGMTRGKHVWSFKVQQRGAMGGICIGVACTDFEFKSKNVGAYRGSWGWSNSGTKGHGEGSFVAYGEGYGTGDVVGIELDCDEGVLRFHKNGVDQGVAFATGLKGHTLLPAVCLGGVRTSSKSSKSSSMHAVQVYPSHCGVQQLQVSADASLVVSSAARIGDTPAGTVTATPSEVTVSFPGDAPPQCSGVTIAAGPSVQMTAGDLPGKASWRFRVDSMQVGAASGAATLRESLQTALPIDGEDMPGVLEQLVQDWRWTQQGTAQQAALQLHYSKALGQAPESTVDTLKDSAVTGLGQVHDGEATDAQQAVLVHAEPSAPEQQSGEEQCDMSASPAAAAPADGTQEAPQTKQGSRVQMGITVGIATDKFLEGLSSAPVGVGCDEAGQSLGVTSAGLLVQGGKCAWLTKSRSVLRPFQFLEVGDVITLSITPQDTTSGAGATGGGAAVAAHKSELVDIKDSSTIIRLKDMQPLGSTVGGSTTQFLNISQLSPMQATSLVQLQDAALTNSGSSPNGLQAVQIAEHTNSDQLTTEVSASGETDPLDTTPAFVTYTVSLSLNGQELCSPVPSELLPRIISGQSLMPVVSLGGGMRHAKLTLLTNAAEADAAVAASLVPARIPRRSCVFVQEAQLPLPLSSMSEDAMTVVFSRHWATVPICTGVPIPPPGDTQPPRAWVPTHGIPLNSGVHAFHAMVKAKAEGGAIVLGFVSAAPSSPFQWGQWHLGANSGSFGVSSAGQVGGGMHRSKANTEQWRSFEGAADGKGAAPSAGPLFKSGSMVTWFVDTDVSPERPHARMGLRVDSMFVGTATTIPVEAFPLVPAVCAGGANGISRHALQLQQVVSALDRTQASKRAVLGIQDRLITCTTSWASAFVQHAGMRSGKHNVYWKLLSQAPAGAVCVGVADLRKFQVTARNVGADSHSWGYSSSGKLSAAKSGEFLDYGVPYRLGDIVGVHLDADAGQLNFSVNGVAQGVALGPVLKSISDLVPALCVGSSRSGTPHSVKLLPLLTQEQVAHTLSKGWRDMWTPGFGEASSGVPGMDGSPVLVNAPYLEGTNATATATAAGAAAE